MISARSFIAALASAFVAVGAIVGDAAAANKANLTAPQLQRVKDVSNYITSIKSLQGRFTQIGPGGQFTEGQFFLQRPGKIRFEYAPPNPVLVVADGWWVGIEDRKKKRTEKYPLSATPLNLLLDDKVDLAKDANIVSFEESEEVVSLTLEDSLGNAPGLLTLYFTKPDLTLQQWTVIDAQGLTTEVTLFDLVKGPNLKPALFRINDNVMIDHGKTNR